MRSTHTYAIMEVSPETYDEVRARLATAGYDHAVMEGGVLDMHGIAIRVEAGHRPTRAITNDDGAPISPAEATGALDGGGPA